MCFVVAVTLFWLDKAPYTQVHMHLRIILGSKCPTGEYLYSIETKDNGGIKNVFNDLSNHRPIFADDRLGRRMTLERKFNTTVSNSSHSQIRSGKNR